MGYFVDKEASILRVLSDPTRLRLAALLAAEGEMCVCRLVEAVGQPQYTVSRHLGQMRAAGLVEARRQGTWMYYTLVKPTCRLEQCLFDFLAGGLDSDMVAQGDRQRLRRAECRNSERGIR